MTIERLAEELQTVHKAVAQVVVGYEDVVTDLMIGLLARGHVLLEGVPGLAKTTLAKTFARASGLSFSRVQFTQDLLPADITGHYFYDRSEESFDLRAGPVFSQIVLADEINRAPPKTQSALLEAMEERQVTIEGDTYGLPDPFMVIATMNPVDVDGVYRLPEAQLDRFMLRTQMAYLSDEQERVMLAHKADANGQRIPTIDPGLIHEARQRLPDVHVGQEVIGYIQALGKATRDHPMIELGASPRAMEQMLKASQAAALLSGRDYVAPDDVKYVASRVLSHRLILDVDAEIEGLTPRDVLEEILEATEVPKGLDQAPVETPPPDTEPRVGPGTDQPDGPQPHEDTDDHRDRAPERLPDDPQHDPGHGPQRSQRGSVHEGLPDRRPHGDGFPNSGPTPHPEPLESGNDPVGQQRDHDAPGQPGGSHEALNQEETGDEPRGSGSQPTSGSDTTATDREPIEPAPPEDGGLDPDALPPGAEASETTHRRVVEEDGRRVTIEEHRRTIEQDGKRTEESTTHRHIESIDDDEGQATREAPEADPASSPDQRPQHAQAGSPSKRTSDPSPAGDPSPRREPRGTPATADTRRGDPGPERPERPNGSTSPEGDPSPGYADASAPGPAESREPTNPAEPHQHPDHEDPGEDRDDAEEDRSGGVEFTVMAWRPPEAAPTGDAAHPSTRARPTAAAPNQTWPPPGWHRADDGQLVKDDAPPSRDADSGPTDPQPYPVEATPSDADEDRSLGGRMLSATARFLDKLTDETSTER